MNRLHWCLLVAAIPIVIAAQIVLQYTEAEIVQYLDRTDGSGAALLRVRSDAKSGHGIEVIAWDADLKNFRCIYRIPNVATDSPTTLASDRIGLFVVLAQRTGVTCLDAKSGKKLWLAHQAASLKEATRADFINQDEHLLVTKRGEDEENSSLAIIHVDTGKLLPGIQVDDVARCLTQGRRIAIQHGRGSEHFGQWDLFDLVGDQAEFVKSMDFVPPEMLPIAKRVDLDVSTMTSYHRDTGYNWYSRVNVKTSVDVRNYAKHTATVEVVPANTFSPERLCSTERSIKNTIRTSLLGFGESIALLSIAALAVAIWTMILTFDGARSPWKYRLVVDAVVITVLFIFLCVPFSHLWSQDQTTAPTILRSSATTLFYSCVPALLAALLLVASFAGLLTERRPFYLWGAFILACALPVLLPSIAVIVFLLFRGYRLVKTMSDRPHDFSERLRFFATDPAQVAKGKSKLRFGIGEVMLLTTGVALFIAIGQLSFNLFFWGFLLAGVFAVSVLLTGDSIQSSTLFISAFMVVIFGAGHRLWDLSGTAVFVCALPTFFALAAVHHYQVAKPVVGTEL